MATPKTSRTRRRIALAATSLLATMALTTAGASPAQAAEQCGRIDVGVSKRTVQPNQTVRVSGSTCGTAGERPQFVRIKLRTREGWRQVGVSQTRRSGRFSRKVRIAVPEGLPVTRVQVVAADAQSPSVPLKLSTPAKPSNSNCPLNNPGFVPGATLPGCSLVASDTASDPNPLSFWGGADCGTWPNNLDPGRPTMPSSGGDSQPTATGAAQGDSSYRSLTVFDGDDISGERCELGENDIGSGPTTFFHEGMRRATYVSLRLPDNFALDTEDWQTVLQMKQAQPSKDDGGGPMIELEATRGEWILVTDWEERWSVPALKNVWTRFVFDVVYSQDPSKGSIQVGVDLNADGDFDDADERSPKLPGATLATQTAPGYEVPPGGAIPSHLRAGIYHNDKFECPPPTGCSAELDNLQVIGS